MPARYYDASKGLVGIVEPIICVLRVLARIAGLAQRLDVANVVSSTVRDWQHMILSQRNFRLRLATAQAAVMVLGLQVLPFLSRVATTVARKSRAAARAKCPPRIGVSSIPARIRRQYDVTPRGVSAGVIGPLAGEQVSTIGCVLLALVLTALSAMPLVIKFGPGTTQGEVSLIPFATGLLLLFCMSAVMRPGIRAGAFTAVGLPSIFCAGVAVEVGVRLVLAAAFTGLSRSTEGQGKLVVVYTTHVVDSNPVNGQPPACYQQVRGLFMPNYTTFTPSVRAI
jgi:hypothetical protein